MHQDILTPQPRTTSKSLPSVAAQVRMPCRTALIAWACSASLLLSGCDGLWVREPLQTFQQLDYYHPTPDNHQFQTQRGNKLIGELYTLNSQHADTLSDIARHFGLGYQEMVLANPHVDPWLLQDNQTITLPMQYIVPDASSTGIVLNLASMRLFYFPEPGQVLSFPIGIGRENWNTPLGSTKIVEKKQNPVWTVPASILKEHQALGDPLPAVVKSGPDNPLGYYAMALGFKNYLIHGTNKPYGIGMQVSHGCIQLYPEDIEQLFPKVKVGTPVKIIHQPYLVAWVNDRLYVEAHPPIERWARDTKRLQQEFRASVKKLADQHRLKPDWTQFQALLDQPTGIPTVIAGDTSPLTAKPLAHPGQFPLSPPEPQIAADDWAVVVKDLPDQQTAYKLAAMFNHQGPAIPATVTLENGEYRVVSGPFKNRQESQKIVRRIEQNFEMDAVIVPPGSHPDTMADTRNTYPQNM